ncbi:MAG: hypothetical protein UU81_C0010G0059 [Microgenomates group bacterium GW2011_GWC1_41_8]|uniref:TVP38/TMEM64 family membrane protein n=2 Tax=Candidatus Roizmaniibacteriota TaxID=1752723 RepID=A0A0G0T6U0_9BACT|nr:MAG: hypothetical protein UU14_C0003G0076 [Candidatus Roizmanbacteria bacterium GW2011_GWB1_40_7]KKR94588.1 MAG: hypothetical protein UU41_C0005G0046 [Candidatus Roizmanbacteria bacterium GW2011_GWA1_41_13]KKS24276.1 MAG: hypothetical protein UU81_C0010G0059 [Microgenomates group bacterium GW2011_GWC1_41_8]OGK48394.1 MAG: hypothetical protein A3A55_04195 [Candidatus Roizmanbacteria bacterium RIFCSPLOWO2_01_FULL_40_14]
MQKTKLFWYVLTIAPILLLVIGYLYPSSFFSNQQKLRNFIVSFGSMAPLVFITIQIIQAVLTPISHYVVGLLGGFMFGVWPGFLYNWIGRMIGSLIAFYLGRKFGRNIVKHVVKEKNIDKYDNFFAKGALVLFLMYFLPAFPDDELSYLAGFSTMKAQVYIPIMMIGHVGGSLGLAYAGNGISYKDPLFIFLSLVTFLGGAVFVFNYKKLQITHSIYDK